MKYYATVTCRRVIEIDAEDYESAVAASDQQVTTLLPEREAWKPEIDVSAVRGLGEDRYYVKRVTEPSQPPLFQVRERQLQYQAGPDNPGIHPDDPILRSFRSSDGAYTYARTMNEVQRELDKQYGRWAKHAVTPQDTGEGAIS